MPTARRIPTAANLLASLALAALAGCGGDPTGALTDADDAAQDGDAQALTHPARHVYTLQHAPFPGGHPTALVHLGKGFNAGGPLNLVVHFHGWSNCIANDVEASGSACTPGAPARIAHNLIGQLDQSGANAALVAVERAFDQATSIDGRLAEAGFLRAMILELLPQIGALAGRSYTEADLGGLVLSTHSGGYLAVADVLDRGGLTGHVRQVLLLDSLYGNFAQFDAWVRGGLGTVRLAVVYSENAGTKANAQAMANRATGWVRAAGLSPSALVDDRTFATLPDAAFDAPLLFKRSALSHDGTAQYYFGKLLAHALR